MNDNLISLSDRTTEEQREIARKGGLASGEARRQKSKLKKALYDLLDLELEESELKEELTSRGIDPTLENGIALKVVLNLLQNGSVKDLKTLIEILGEDKTDLDILEQESKINYMESRTEALTRTMELAPEDVNLQIVAIADLINSPTKERELNDFID